MTELSEKQLAEVIDAVYRTTGIRLHQGKRHLVQARLMKRMRSLGIMSYSDYLEFVDQDRGGDEFSEMINILTTNKTEFFREIRHFDFLRTEIFPGYDSRSLKVWSAGCSSGEEVYSIAVHALEHITSPGINIKILGTDISSTVLEKAKKGVYKASLLEQFEGVKKKHFKSVRDVPDMIEAGTALKSKVRFARLNLFDTWPMKGQFDIIFCRNVMIYFDKEHQENLVRRFYDYLGNGGYLFIGHSESLAGMEHKFSYIQPAVYRK